MFTVYDLCYLFLEGNVQEVEIFRYECGTVFSGTADEAMFSDYAEEEISSLDNIEKDSEKITINIL